MPAFTCGSSTIIAYLSTHVNMQLQPLQAILHDCLPDRTWAIKFTHFMGNLGALAYQTAALKNRFLHVK